MIDRMAKAWLDSVERKDAAIMQLSVEIGDLRAENERLRALVEYVLACDGNDYTVGDEWVAEAETALAGPKR